MGVYIFVLAAAIAVFGILIFYKRNVELIKEDPSNTPEAHKNFFIGAAISESIPLILVIMGIVNLEQVPMEEIYFPAIIVVFLMVFSLFFIFLQRAVGTDEESKPRVTTFSLIAVAVTNAIPFIALLFLFMSTQA